jgi:trk system potassium uptake protein TrkH
VFPEINIGGYKIFSIEEKKSYLIARVFVIYGILTFVQVTLLSAGGVSWFKSFCISFSTMSTGCFLPDKNAIADYTPYIQMIIAVFMLFSGLGGLFYYKLSKLRESNFRRNEEFRFYIISFLIVAMLFTWILHSQSSQSIGGIIRGSIFQTASFLSSSGYEISEYRLWPHYFQPLLYLLIVVGGCTNSSSGGIKMSRFLVLFRNIRTPFKNPLSDSEISEILVNGKKIDEETNLNILTFITIFGFVLVVGTLVLTFVTNDLKKSVFLTVTSLSTFGHNMDITHIPQVGKILISMLMLIGRLEIFPFLALLIPSFYKKSILDS